jgi:hypothetical protein
LTGIVIWATSQQRPQEPTLVVQPQPALPASLHLKISPSVESTVTVNGKVVSTGSDVLHADLVPDKPFELRVTAPGYLPYSDRYTVAAGERLRVPVRLTPIPIARQQPKIETTTDTPATPATPATPDAPEPAAPGMLSVNVRGGWAEVSVDGRSVDTTPLYQHPLPAGRHTVEIVDGASGARQTRVVTIIPNQTTRVNF